MSSGETHTVRSCGVLIWRKSKKDKREFLLMEHPKRWDLPKGHVDPGETDMECALRELDEETGIKADDIRIDPGFRFEHNYVVNLKRFNNEPADKTLVIFLAELINKVKIVPTEHESFEWFKWDPPHDIQRKSLNPLLEELEAYWRQQPLRIAEGT